MWLRNATTRLLVLKHQAVGEEGNQNRKLKLAGH